MKKVTFCKLKTSFTVVETLFTIYKYFGDFVKCIFTILLQIQHENNFLPISTCKCRQLSQRQPLSCYLFVQLLHLSLKYRLPKMPQSEIPPWLWSQNSEQPRIFRVSGANQNMRKVLFTDQVNTYLHCLSNFNVNIEHFITNSSMPISSNITMPTTSFSCNLHHCKFVMIRVNEYFLHQQHHVACVMTSSIIPSLSVLNT